MKTWVKHCFQSEWIAIKTMAKPKSLTAKTIKRQSLREFEDEVLAVRIDKSKRTNNKSVKHLPVLVERESECLRLTHRKRSCTIHSKLYSDSASAETSAPNWVTMNDTGRCKWGSNDDVVEIWVQRPTKSLLTLGTHYYNDRLRLSHLSHPWHYWLTIHYLLQHVHYQALAYSPM